MPMSNAERQRLFRMRRDADPTRRRKYLEDKKKKYKEDLNNLKRKNVSNMTSREKRHMKKVWRTYKRKYRQRQKQTNISRKTIQKKFLPLDSLRTKYNDTRKKQKLNVIRNINMAVLKKFKLKTEAIHLIGMKMRSSTCLRTCQSGTCLTKRLCRKVTEFYIRDDNSRLMTGVKNTVTKAKCKMQRRVILDNLKSLHVKFVLESKMKISPGVFARLRPFSVVFSTDRDKNTCLCRLCENTQFMINGLNKSKAIDTANLDCLIEDKVCSTERRDCMYNECKLCSSGRLIINKAVLSEEITWYEWKIKKAKRTIKKENKSEHKEVSFTVKEAINGTVDMLKEMFEKQLEIYMKHSFNCRIQFQCYKQNRERI